MLLLCGVSRTHHTAGRSAQFRVMQCPAARPAEALQSALGLTNIHHCKVVSDKLLCVLSEQALWRWLSSYWQVVGFGFGHAVW